MTTDDRQLGVPKGLFSSGYNVFIYSPVSRYDKRIITNSTTIITKHAEMYLVSSSYNILVVSQSYDILDDLVIRFIAL